MSSVSQMRHAPNKIVLRRYEILSLRATSITSARLVALPGFCVLRHVVRIARELGMAILRGEAVLGAGRPPLGKGRIALLGAGGKHGGQRQDQNPGSAFAHVICLIELKAEHFCAMKDSGRKSR